MLKIENVSYSYHKGTIAVDDASAEIGAGIYLLLGENGAGKTTLLHLMSGLLFPQSGKCLFDGTDTAKRTPATTSHIFFMPDDFTCPFPSIVELARRHGLFYPTFNYEMMYANLEDFGLTGKEKLRSLSLGMRRKSYMAYALALGVDCLLLDEPTNGMDIDSKKVLRKIMSRCVGDDQSVVISTHNVHDLYSMFDNIIVMRHGRLRVAMPIGEVLERIAFVSSPSPVEGCIYQEPDMGRFKAIVPNEHHIDTDMDYPLFYSAIMAPVGDMFIDFLTSKDLVL